MELPHGRDPSKASIVCQLQGDLHMFVFGVQVPSQHHVATLQGRFSRLQSFLVFRISFPPQPSLLAKTQRQMV